MTELLGGARGNLSCDDYSAYGCLSTKKVSRNRSGRWGHGRRGVCEAMLPGVEGYESREALDMIVDLYCIEDEAEREGDPAKHESISSFANARASGS